jgi:hypothetical protein
MGDKQVLAIHRKKAALGCIFAAALILTSAMAAAQDAAPPENEGFFATISRWFKERTSTVNSSFEDARKKVQGFSSAAGDAAKSTVQGAKDAAGAVARIPTARAISGHEQCQVAANGAPDCVAAANALCKTKGFDYGSSLDMTTAEVCPPKVYMSGRSTGNECKMETFVSRAFCQ